MPIELDRRRLLEIVRGLGDELGGEWVLLGGALTAIWLVPRRVTGDIDIVGISGVGDERLELMLAAEKLGLPIEAVNSAADFFLKRIPGWQDRLEVLLKGTSATIYRPDPTLFLLLKSKRLSEQDLDDCRAMLDRVRKDDLALDRPVILEYLDRLPVSEDDDLLKRRAELRAGLDRGSSGPATD